MPFNIQPIPISIALFVSLATKAQSSDSLPEKKLDEVIIKAFQQNRKLKDIPAAVNYIGPSLLERFNPTSIVQAVNSTPGIHLEERSPGSYRFNIRGSSLRSPFGVRNVKIYFNDIPFTDPSGNTYFNQLGFYNIQTMEIIKGPGSSLYGAGTGGVLLIESNNDNPARGPRVEYSTGSFGLQNIYGSFTSGKDNFISKVGYQHQESQGYRDQSAMRRDVLNWTGNLHFSNKGELKLTWLYSDLYYQTPGALTLAEYNLNPRASRPKAGAFPSAVTAKATIFQKTFITGASYTQPLSSDWENKTVLYGAFTELRNPGIRNYGKNSEPHAGGRTSFNFHKLLGTSIFDFTAGAEIQNGFFTENVFKNVNGNPDSLQTNDEINNRQSFVFAQASLDIKNWIITAGASLNQLHINFQRFAPNALPDQVINYNNEIAPRIAIEKKFRNITVYSSLAKGFSPPTTAELFPTGSAVNISLQAEKGINYDLGFRGTLLSRLYIDINAFVYSLNNAIVQRRDAGGGDYYINSGKTDQHGVETYLNYTLIQNKSTIEQSFIWLSYTNHDFHYSQFKQLATDFSGKRLPGEAPNTIAAGFNINFKNGFSALVNYIYNDKIALNDANSEFAGSYHLLGTQLSYREAIKKLHFRVFAGGDNLLNQKYSLGNDINAAGGRYYNAAPEINYYAGISFQLIR